MYNPFYTSSQILKEVTSLKIIRIKRAFNLKKFKDIKEAGPDPFKRMDSIHRDLQREPVDELRQEDPVNQYGYEEISLNVGQILEDIKSKIFYEVVKIKQDMDDINFSQIYIKPIFNRKTGPIQNGEIITTPFYNAEKMSWIDDETALEIMNSFISPEQLALQKQEEEKQRKIREQESLKKKKQNKSKKELKRQKDRELREQMKGKR